MRVDRITQPRPDVRRLVLSLMVAVCVSGCAGGPTNVHQVQAQPTTAPVIKVAQAPAAPPQATASGTPEARGGSTHNALALLATLPVKGRAAKTGYRRDQYGQAWADADRNGCDTRNDILKRDLTQLVYKAGTRDCAVLSGTLADRYTSADIQFVRGGASEVDIDHVVALGNTWVTGAAAWPFNKRVAIANDPLNLLAVDSSANRQKGDGDAATWLPSNKSYRCAYVARQVAVKAKYALWVTAAEGAAMTRVLSGCPDQLAPTGGTPTVAPINAQPPVGQQPRQPTSPAPAPEPGSSSVYFQNCAAARAAGAAPLHRGDPGYRSGLDRDSDGTACE